MTDSRSRYQADQVPSDPDIEIPRAVKQEMLKLMMKEREETSRRLVKLDYRIWVLEEYFRSGET